MDGVFDGVDGGLAGYRMFGNLGAITLPLASSHKYAILEEGVTGHSTFSFFGRLPQERQVFFLHFKRGMLDYLPECPVCRFSYLVDGQPTVLVQYRCDIDEVEAILHFHQVVVSIQLEGIIRKFFAGAAEELP